MNGGGNCGPCVLTLLEEESLLSFLKPLISSPKDRVNVTSKGFANRRKVNTWERGERLSFLSVQKPCKRNVQRSFFLFFFSTRNSRSQEAEDRLHR